MKKILFLFLLFDITGCNAQNKRSDKHIPVATIDTNKPDVKTNVIRKYDDKGNLIGYDSTYSWSYSTKGRIHNVEADSVMSAFRKQFSADFPSLFNSSFGEPVWADSLFYRDFTAPDYFMRRWNDHYFDMSKMMQRMDSLRNTFLNRNYPGLKVTPKQKD